MKTLSLRVLIAGICAVAAGGQIVHAETLVCKAPGKRSFSLTAEPSVPATVQKTLEARLKLGTFSKRRAVTLKQAPRGGTLNYAGYWEPSAFWLSLGEFKGEGIYSKASLVLNRGSKEEKKLELSCVLSGPVAFKNSCEVTADNDPQANLLQAVRFRKLDLLEETLACQVEVNALDENGCTPLLVLTDEDCGTGVSKHLADAQITEMLESLLLAGADFEIDATDPTTGETALHKITRLQDLAAVLKLLDSGADLNAQDNDGSTPLMRAVEERYLKLVETLVARGANLELTNSEGLTARDVAKKLGYHELIDSLSVANTVTVEGNSAGECSPMNIQLKLGVTNKIILKTANPMLMLDSSEFDLSLMATPGVDVSALVTPEKAGSFEMTCGPKMGGGNPKGAVEVK